MGQDRRERVFDDEEQLRIAMRALQSRLWTALPGSVAKFYPATMTVDVQPTINGLYTNTVNELVPIQMPVLPDVPVVWLGGGGATLTYPIAIGDECLVIFAARDIDAWFKNGWVPGTSVNSPNVAMNPPELRMHNLSDGFALVGVRSLPHVLPNVSTTAAELRTNDRSAYASFNPTAKTLSIVMPGGVTVNGVTIDTNGNVGSPATVTASTDVVQGAGGSAISLKNHVHPNGSPDTGPPVAGT